MLILTGFLAISLHCCSGSAAAPDLPPFAPPSCPRLTAAESLPCSSGVGGRFSTCPVVMSGTSPFLLPPASLRARLAARSARFGSPACAAARAAAASLSAPLVLCLAALPSRPAPRRSPPSCAARRRRLPLCPLSAAVLPSPLSLCVLWRFLRAVLPLLRPSRSRPAVSLSSPPSSPSPPPFSPPSPPPPPSLFRLSAWEKSLGCLARPGTAAAGQLKPPKAK